jgi:hypothetical protein
MMDGNVCVVPDFFFWWVVVVVVAVIGCVVRRYCKFTDEEHTDAARKALLGQCYAGRPLVCEFSPVTDFREARCRQHDKAVCTRGGYVR